jgi:hypothetical protein
MMTVSALMQVMVWAGGKFFRIATDARDDLAAISMGATTMIGRKGVTAGRAVRLHGFLAKDSK